MINIPTELLRTLVAVADLKSFTKAAQTLGVTQPAVSAQIKRLHTLLGSELFDKGTKAIELTREGEAAVAYARRLLSLNDQILQIAAPAPAARVLRIGMTGDYVTPLLPQALVKFRKRSQYHRFHVTICMNNERLLHDLRTGDLDVVIMVTSEKPEIDARHHWTVDLVWARAASTVLDPAAPVPLVTRGDEWVTHRLAVSALDLAGRSYEVVFVGPTILNLMSAVRCGLGIMPFSRNRVLDTDLVICEEPHLPRLPTIGNSIYISEIGDSTELQALADEIARVIRPSDTLSARAKDAAQTVAGELVPI